MVKKLKSFEELKKYSVIEIDKKALDLSKKNVDEAFTLLTNQSTTNAQSLLKDLQEGTEEEYLQHKPQSKP